MTLTARARRYLKARGPTDTARQVVRFAWRKVFPSISAVEKRRRQLGRVLFQRFDGVVQAGPLRGLRLNPNSTWGLSDYGPMLLGLYEDHVCEVLADLAGPAKVLVDIGSADGYFGVGVVASGLFSRSICFELDPISRTALIELATYNGVADRVVVHGSANTDFVDTLRSEGLSPEDVVILCDVEGFEFELFTVEVLNALQGASIVIELHDRYGFNGAARLSALIGSAERHFAVSLIDRRGRNPFIIPALDGFAEDDQWLLCSEGRLIAQRWMILKPRTKR